MRKVVNINSLKEKREYRRYATRSAISEVDQLLRWFNRNTEAYHPLISIMEKTRLELLAVLEENDSRRT